MGASDHSRMCIATRFLKFTKSWAGWLSLVLVGCASEPETPGVMSDAMKSRLLKPDLEKRSSFESDMVASKVKAGDRVSNSAFSTKDWMGASEFKVNDYRTKNYPGVRESHDTSMTYGEARSARESEQMFRSKDSPDAKRVARQQDQSFREGDQVFVTQMVRDAERSQQQNNRPVIIDTGERMTPAAPQTEEDIRRMLNRK